MPTRTIAEKPAEDALPAQELGDSAVPPLSRIVATVGPATDDRTLIAKLIEAGVSVFRLNFSHGELSTHEQRINTIREVSREMSRPVALLGDLQGPKIRVGKVAGDAIEVETGSKVIFQRTPTVAESTHPPHIFSSTYARLVDEVAPGERLLVNDGEIRMLIVECEDDSILCRVTCGGRISSGKGINLPDSNLSLAALTDRDLEHAQWAVEKGLDFLALSFVNTAGDVRTLARHISTCAEQRGDSSLRMPIVAKIERPGAVEHIEEIVDTADAIMVARGDLGVEMDLARVPIIQKQLLRTAQDYGKPCIVATQMLQSMIVSPAPTRAEVSDVAGAIFDGADAIMLSGETAVGKYPLLAVDVMRRIALETEGHLATLPREPSAPGKLVETRYRTAALAHGVWTIAGDLGAKFIVVWSQTGGGARYLSQNNFRIPILAISTNERALRQMQLLRGVLPLKMPLAESLAHFTYMVDEYLQGAGWAKPGEQCILVAGMPIGTPQVTNCLAIHTIGDPNTGFQSQP